MTDVWSDAQIIPRPNTETLDKLWIEWSNFTNAKSTSEIRCRVLLERALNQLLLTPKKAHKVHKDKRKLIKNIREELQGVI